MHPRPRTRSGSLRKLASPIAYNPIYRPLKDPTESWLIHLTDELLETAGTKDDSIYREITCTLLPRRKMESYTRSLTLHPTWTALLIREVLERVTAHSESHIPVVTERPRWYGDLEHEKMMTLGVKLAPPPENEIIHEEVRAICGSLGDITGRRVNPSEICREPHLSLMIFEEGVDPDLREKLVEKVATAIPKVIWLAPVFYEQAGYLRRSS